MPGKRRGKGKKKGKRRSRDSAGTSGAGSNGTSGGGQSGAGSRASRLTPWDNCRHGGPQPGPEILQGVGALTSNVVRALRSGTSISDAVLELEPILTHGANGLSPKQLRAAPLQAIISSIGVDAWINRDIDSCRCFTAVALVLAFLRESKSGPSAFFQALRAHSAKPGKSWHTRLASLATNEALYAELKNRSKCRCLATAAAMGVGVSLPATPAPAEDGKPSTRVAPHDPAADRNGPADSETDAIPRTLLQLYTEVGSSREWRLALRTRYKAQMAVITKDTTAQGGFRNDGSARSHGCAHDSVAACERCARAVTNADAAAARRRLKRVGDSVAASDTVAAMIRVIENVATSVRRHVTSANDSLRYEQYRRWANDNLDFAQFGMFTIDVISDLAGHSAALGEALAGVLPVLRRVAELGAGQLSHGTVFALAAIGLHVPVSRTRAQGDITLATGALKDCLSRDSAAWDEDMQLVFEYFTRLARDVPSTRRDLTSGLAWIIIPVTFMQQLHRMTVPCTCHADPEAGRAVATLVALMLELRKHTDVFKLRVSAGYTTEGFGDAIATDYGDFMLHMAQHLEDDRLRRLLREFYPPFAAAEPLDRVHPPQPSRDSKGAPRDTKPTGAEPGAGAGAGVGAMSGVGTGDGAGAGAGAGAEPSAVSSGAGAGPVASAGAGAGAGADPPAASADGSGSAARHKLADALVSIYQAPASTSDAGGGVSADDHLHARRSAYMQLRRALVTADASDDATPPALASSVVAPASDSVAAQELTACANKAAERGVAGSIAAELHAFVGTLLPHARGQQRRQRLKAWMDANAASYRQAVFSMMLVLELAPLSPAFAAGLGDQVAADLTALAGVPDLALKRMALRVLSAVAWTQPLEALQAPARVVFAVGEVLSGVAELDATSWYPSMSYVLRLLHRLAQRRETAALIHTGPVWGSVCDLFCHHLLRMCASRFPALAAASDSGSAIEAASLHEDVVCSISRVMRSLAEADVGHGVGTLLSFAADVVLLPTGEPTAFTWRQLIAKTCEEYNHTEIQANLRAVLDPTAAHATMAATATAPASAPAGASVPAQPPQPPHAAASAGAVTTVDKTCGYAGCDKVGPHRCSRCRAAFYCSRDHQRKDWRVHKRVCAATQS